MGQHREAMKTLHAQARDLREQIGEVYDAYSSLHRAALGDGALSAKTKELIALGIAISDHCDGCIDSHARGAARRGATPDEVAEAIGVAIQMTGGPGTVYGPRAWEAYKEFAES